MLLMRIDRWDVRRDGALSDRTLRQKLERLGYDPASRPQPAGSVPCVQIDNRDRLQAVVSGLVKVTVDGEAAVLTSGDIVFVPRGAVRRIEAVGTAPAFCLEAVFHYELEPAVG
jgi:hypothetical protein